VVGTAIFISRYFEKVGARAPKTSFHSLRHGLTDALRRARATGDRTDDLLGWTRGNMRERYGLGPFIMMLAEACSRSSIPA
jgi:integrase